MPVRERLRTAVDSPLAEEMRAEAEEYLMSLYVRSALESHPGPRRRYDAERVGAWLALLAGHREIAVDRLAGRHVSSRTSSWPGPLAPHRLWPLGGRRLVRVVDVALAAAVTLRRGARVRHRGPQRGPGHVRVADSGHRALRHRGMAGGPVARGRAARRRAPAPPGVPAHRLVRIDRLAFGLFNGGGYGLAVGYHLVGETVTGPADLSAAVWGRRPRALCSAWWLRVPGRSRPGARSRAGRTAGAITSSSCARPCGGAFRCGSGVSWTGLTRAACCVWTACPTASVTTSSSSTCGGGTGARAWSRQWSTPRWGVPGGGRRPRPADRGASDTRGHPRVRGVQPGTDVGLPTRRHQGRSRGRGRARIVGRAAWVRYHCVRGGRAATTRMAGGPHPP